MAYARLMQKELWVYFNKAEVDSYIIENGLFVSDMLSVSRLETMISVINDNPAITAVPGDRQTTKIILPNRYFQALKDANQHIQSALDTHMCLIGRLDKKEQLIYSTIMQAKGENNGNK